jgi:hypothetical protein
MSAQGGRLILTVLAAVGAAIPAAAPGAAQVQPASPATDEPTLIETPAAEEATPAAAFAEAANLDEAFFHLHYAVNALAEAAELSPGTDVAAIGALQAQVNRLEDLCRQRPGSTPNADYIRDPATLNASLPLLRRDLELKIASAVARMGATGVAPGMIRVTVTTQFRNANVRGFLVKVGGSLYANSPPAYSFSNVTNPTTDGWMIPGLYIFRVYNPQGREVVVANREQGVGLDGASAARVTVTLR